MQGLRAITLIHRPERRAAPGSRRGGLLLMALARLFLGLIRPGLLGLALLGLVPAG